MSYGPSGGEPNLLFSFSNLNQAILGTTREYDLLGNGHHYPEEDLRKNHIGEVPLGQSVYDEPSNRFCFKYLRNNVDITLALGDGVEHFDKDPNEAPPTLVESLRVSRLQF